MWKDFFYYTRAERQGIIVLIVLIVVVFSVPMFLRMARSSTAVGTEESRQAFEKEYDEFVSSLQKKGGSRSNTNSYRKRPSTPPPAAVTLFYFDPNTADSAAFLSLGLSPQVASNILRYRRKQGRFRRPEDFRKIYGLTEEQFQTLLPYIRIAEQPIAHDTTSLLTSSPSSREVPKKYPAGTLVSLNEADTTELKKIPGIGSGIARMIVDYRRRLGAFYRIEQLEEIHLNVEKLRPWFTVDTTFIKPH